MFARYREGEPLHVSFEIDFAGDHTSKIVPYESLWKNNEPDQDATLPNKWSVRRPSHWNDFVGRAGGL